MLFNLKEIIDKINNIIIQNNINTHSLVANFFSWKENWELIKSFIWQTSLTFNSETQELWAVIKSIIDLKIFKNQKDLENLYEEITKINFEISRIEKDLNNSINDEKEIINEMKLLWYKFDSNNNLLNWHTEDFYVWRLNASKLNIVKNQKKVIEKSKEKIDIVFKSIAFIAFSIEKIWKENDFKHIPNILVTNGPYGMSGLLYNFDYRVIAWEGVLESATNKEKKNYMRNVKIY